jgi:hypothetical protein
MSNVSSNDRIEDVAPGDLILVDRGDGEQAFKVVHKERSDSGFLVTFESDDAETFQLELAADTEITRSLESKWESAQSPTGHADTDSA